MKKIQYSILSVFSLALVFFVFNTFIYNQKQANNHTKEATPTAVGVVTNVDMSPMAYDGPALITIKTDSGDSKTIAVASMGRNLCEAKDFIADVSLVSVGDMISVRGEIDTDGRIVPCMDNSDYLKVAGEVSDKTIGFVFNYPKAPNGYIVEDISKNNMPSQFVLGFVLTEKTEYEAMQQATGPREGPPTIQVHAYKNDKNESASVWALRNSEESLSNLIIGETKEAVVGGANAVEYKTDGLYANHVFVVAHGGYMYVLIGSYVDVSSPIHSDFDDIVASFRFVEPALDATPKTVTMSGTYVCLPHVAQSDFQTMECAFGLKADDGNFYAVNFGQSAGAMEQFVSGERVRAEGFVVVKEALSSNQWEKYNMKGIFTITRFLKN